MTPLQIVAVGVRLLALVWLLYTLNNLHNIFFYLDREVPIPSNKAFVWGFALVQMCACALLWLFPRTIAAKLLSSRDAELPAPPPRLVEWQTLGVILIGLWAVTTAIGNAIYWITFVTFDPGGFSDLSPDYKSSVVTTVAELAIGLWLLLGAKGIAAALFKIRTAGRSE